MIEVVNPALPSGPIRIAGQSWNIEVCEVPYPDDPDYVSYRYQERQAIAIAAHLLSHQQAWQFWIHLWQALYAPLAWGEGEAATSAEKNAVCRAMWAAFRDNAAAVAGWFGWVGTPWVAEGPIRVLGQPWYLRRVYRIPRHSAEVYGLESNDDNTLYVRSDLMPEFAAECALHELTHAAVRPISKLGGEEAFVRPMAMGLAQVFFDNPAAMATLFGVVNGLEADSA